MKLLMIDNFDSFTFNLVHLFQIAGAETTVFRNNADELINWSFHDVNLICISPGPGRPEETGHSRHILDKYIGKIPIFGVCLGMQLINEFFGGKTRISDRPVHGKTSTISHTGHKMFENIPSPFTVARYHSLQSMVVSEDIEVTATCDEGIVMALAHKTEKLWGVQFHPESFLSVDGLKIAENVLEMAKSNV